MNKVPTPRSWEVESTELTDSYHAAPTTGDKLFDITCVVGSVYRGVHGDLSPREVAFLMIARADHDGEFHFPNEDGLDICVAVAETRTPKA